MKTRMRNVMLGAMVVIALTAGVGYADLSYGLVGHWCFDDVDYPGTDCSGNGHDGTVIGAIPASGKVGSALSFDGIDSYVQIEDSTDFDFGSAITMTAFVKLSSLIAWQAHTIIYSRQIHSRNQLQFTVVTWPETDEGKPFGEVNFEVPLWGAGVYGSSLSTNEWYHLAIVYDGTSLKMFIDGEVSATQTKTSGGTDINGQSIVGSEYPLAIGRTYDGPVGNITYHYSTYEDNFHGLIDEVRIYNRALEASEIQQLAGGEPTPVVEDFYLHGVALDLTLDNAAPTGATAKYKDSPSIRRTEFKEIGTWTYTIPSDMSLQSAEDLHVWVGLKNSDDQGTYFDIRAELLKNGASIASCETQNIQGVTRNPDKAKEVALNFGAIPDGEFAAGDTLSLRILTKVTAVGGHSNAVGLRLYYDSISRPSGLTITSSQ